MRQRHRRSAMRVRDGIVQPKNRWTTGSPSVDADRPQLIIDRRRPGDGFRHLVRQAELRQFVESLPEWQQLRRGIETIVLDYGRTNCMGWYDEGVVAICAWEQQLRWFHCDQSFFDQHAAVFEKLNIPIERHGGTIEVNFTMETARAFQLVHVLVHELGHHHDQMTTRSGLRPCRGERYAEDYARRHEDQIIALYRQQFAE